jgi:heterotetrameric sarcosine oxidase gamma subunit
MPPSASSRPTRRSPLEHVHAALGAAWLDDTARWPETYGDEAAEIEAVVEAAGIADIGPIDKLVIRGPHTSAALLGVGVSGELRSVVSGRGKIEAWCLADDEALLLLPGFPSSEAGTSRTRLAEGIRATGATVTDQSSAFSVFRLVGPASPAILEEACAVDLSPDTLEVGGIAQAAMAGVRVSLARQDHAQAPGYTLLTARDEAEYLWASLLMLGSTFGLVPVGGNVAGGMPHSTTGQGA